MRRIALFASLLALGAGSAVYAQTQPAPQPTQPADAQTVKPRELMVAPDSPEKTREAIRSNPGHKVESFGRPANVCAELVAFMEQKAKQPAAAEASAAQKPDQKPAQKAGEQNAPPAPGAAEQNTAASQKPTPQTGTAGPGQTAPPMDRAQQTSGISAPIPQDDRSTGSSEVTIEKAQSLAQANDLRGCQTAVRTMRLAGMALPPGLLVLGALREDLLANMQPAAAQQAAPGAAPPAQLPQPATQPQQAPSAEQSAPAQPSATPPPAPGGAQ